MCISNFRNFFQLQKVYTVSHVAPNAAFLYVSQQVVRMENGTNLSVKF